jgi:hypothetical protein
MQEADSKTFFELINRVTKDADLGIKGNSSEILRHLLDPESMNSDQSQERNLFLNLFYEKFLERLVAVFDLATTGTQATLVCCSQILQAKS